MKKYLLAIGLLFSSAYLVPESVNKVVAAGDDDTDESDESFSDKRFKEALARGQPGAVAKLILEKNFTERTYLGDTFVADALCRGVAY